jgi:hypothetical protein
MNNNWRGFVIDSSKLNIRKLRSSYYFWKHNLTAVSAFITENNINELLEKSGFEEDLGLLSIDIDGNDYYVLEAIKNFKPRILIVEYNATFGFEREISIPYRADFDRTVSHYSNLYFGASLPSFEALAISLGYSFVTTVSGGGNAIFVRNDVLNLKITQMISKDRSSGPECRESRDKFGKLDYLGAKEREDVIRGMPVWNTNTRSPEVF